MLGYFDNQEATENSFNAQSWYMTGDLGWMDENGYLRITGRKKDVIIRGGHNICPAKIEALAGRHPAVEREVRPLGLDRERPGSRTGARRAGSTRRGNAAATAARLSRAAGACSRSGHR
jgi:acyl-CoA synthetase (AMP-forming)/AMP-acid ligase II